MAPVIDTHAHVVPERYKRAIASGATWHGLGPKAGGVMHPRLGRSLAERLSDMDRYGVDVQLVTPTVGFYQYANDIDVTRRVASDCNDEIAEIVDAHPDRFAGMATLPMQDIPSALEEMERAIGELRLVGVMISDHVSGKTYDEADFRPFFAKAESLGALIMFHQGGDTIVSQRIKRFHLGNGVGNLTERALVFAALVFSGVMDEFPNLRVLLPHGGGFVAQAVHRLDKIAGAYEGGYPETGLQPPFGWDPGSEFHLTRPPSMYLDRFHYDTCVYSGSALRYIIDTVGVERVVLGTDYPAPMVQDDPVRWLNGLVELSSEEKEMISRSNPARLIGI